MASNNALARPSFKYSGCTERLYKRHFFLWGLVMTTMDATKLSLQLMPYTKTLLFLNSFLYSDSFILSVLKQSPSNFKRALILFKFALNILNSSDCIFFVLLEFETKGFNCHA